MLHTIQTNSFMRNYLIAAVTVITMSAGVADLFNNPTRIAQQERLDGYGRYVSAGLVSYAKTTLNR